MRTSVVEASVELLGEPHHDGSELRASAPRASSWSSGACARARGRRARPPAHRPRRRGARDRGRDRRGDRDRDVVAGGVSGSPRSVTRYRWLLAGGETGYALGERPRPVPRSEVPDADDFVAHPGAGGPDVAPRLGRVPDLPRPLRARPAPRGSTRRTGRCRATGTPCRPGARPDTPREWFGGDLRGIEQHLDHVERARRERRLPDPVLPGRLDHRYDASTFDRVDPLLGGDEALASLTAAAHARGMRVIGDLTPNHTGNGHEWFSPPGRARTPSSAASTTSTTRSPHGYASWWGVRPCRSSTTASPELRRAAGRRRRPAGCGRRSTWTAGGSTSRTWPAGTAAIDHDHELARATRRVLLEAKQDALLVAEHGHDFRDDLRGDGWHGTMNYAGFLRPVW